MENREIPASVGIGIVFEQDPSTGHHRISTVLPGSGAAERPNDVQVASPCPVELKTFSGLEPESQGHYLAVTVLYVPCWLDSGWERRGRAAE